MLRSSFGAQANAGTVTLSPVYLEHRPQAAVSPPYIIILRARKSPPARAAGSRILERSCPRGLTTARGGSELEFRVYE